MSAQRNTPNTEFPLGAFVTIVDAYGHNPIAGAVRRQVNAFDLVVEDTRGVIHFAQTWRVTLDDPTFEDMLA